MACKLINATWSANNYHRICAQHSHCHHVREKQHNHEQIHREVVRNGEVVDLVISIANGWPTSPLGSSCPLRENTAQVRSSSFNENLLQVLNKRHWYLIIILYFNANYLPCKSIKWSFVYALLFAWFLFHFKEIDKS